MQWTAIQDFSPHDACRVIKGFRHRIPGRVPPDRARGHPWGGAGSKPTTLSQSVLGNEREGRPRPTVGMSAEEERPACTATARRKPQVAFVSVLDHSSKRGPQHLNFVDHAEPVLRVTLRDILHDQKFLVIVAIRETHELEPDVADGQSGFHGTRWTRVQLYPALPGVVDGNDPDVERNRTGRAPPPIGAEARGIPAFPIPASGVRPFRAFGRTNGVDHEAPRPLRRLEIFHAREHIDLAQRPRRTPGFGEAKERP